MNNLNTNYSVIKKKTDNALNDSEIAIGDGDYIVLQYAPADAEVQIRINKNTNPQILLKPNSGVISKDTRRIYVSCKAVSGGELVFLTAKNEDLFKYIPPVAGKFDIGITDEVKAVGIVNDFSPTAVDKIKSAMGDIEITEIDRVVNIENITKIQQLNKLLQVNDILRVRTLEDVSDVVVDKLKSTVGNIDTVGEVSMLEDISQTTMDRLREIRDEGLEWIKDNTKEKVIESFSPTALTSLRTASNPRYSEVAGGSTTITQGTSGTKTVSHPAGKFNARYRIGVQPIFASANTSWGATIKLDTGQYIGTVNKYTNMLIIDAEILLTSSQLVFTWVAVGMAAADKVIIDYAVEQRLY